MTETATDLAATNKKQVAAVRRKLRAAENSSVDAMEMIVVGLCLRNILEWVVRFHELQIEELKGGVSQNGMNLNSFGEWLASKSHWTKWNTPAALEVGEIFSGTAMVIYYGDNFHASSMVYEAEAALAPVWLPRLAGVVGKLNAHPYTRDLPPIELVVKTNQVFDFTVRFAVD